MSKGVTKEDEQPAVALRLTPKPLELIRRIATLVEWVQSVACPTTVATDRLEAGERTWTVHLCTWVGIGTPRKADVAELRPRHSTGRAGLVVGRVGVRSAMDDYSESGVLALAGVTL